VVGLELLEAAVRDAERNATLNHLGNTQWVAGPVEKTLDAVLEGLPAGTRVVAVLDPPRSGVPPTVIRSLRRCTAVRALVYVACDPAQAAGNLLDLCRRESKRITGLPFQLTAACGVDLFPHTAHIELIARFSR
jgi:tRNA (uracil-5-)-methyltransferase